MRKGESQPFLCWALPPRTSFSILRHPIPQKSRSSQMIVPRFFCNLYTVAPLSLMSSIAMEFVITMASFTFESVNRSSLPSSSWWWWWCWSWWKRTIWKREDLLAATTPPVPVYHLCARTWTTTKSWSSGRRCCGPCLARVVANMRSFSRGAPFTPSKWSGPTWMESKRWSIGNTRDSLWQEKQEGHLSPTRITQLLQQRVQLASEIKVSKL